MLFDAVVQLAGQSFAFLVHSQGPDLVAQARVVFAQFVKVLLVLFQVLGQEIKLIVEVP